MKPLLVIIALAAIAVASCDAGDTSPAPDAVTEDTPQSIVPKEIITGHDTMVVDQGPDCAELCTYWGRECGVINGCECGTCEDGEACMEEGWCIDYGGVCASDGQPYGMWRQRIRRLLRRMPTRAPLVMPGQQMRLHPRLRRPHLRL